MILGLNSRKLLKVEELGVKVSPKSPTAMIDWRRLGLWIGLRRQKRGLTKKLLGSYMKDPVNQKGATH